MTDAEPVPAAWPPWSAPAALLGALSVSLLVGALIAVAVVVAGGSETRDQGTIDVVGTLAQDAALIGVAVALARMTAGAVRPEQFGLVAPRGSRWGRAAGWAVLGLLAFLVFTATWSALLGQAPKENLVHQLGADRESFARYAVAALVCVIAPVAEEVFFRGFFFTALRNWHGVGAAALITGAVFGLVHAGSAPVVYLVPLGFLGVVLCLLYVRTGSLYPGIGLHLINNTVAFGDSVGWGWQIPVLAAVSGVLVATGLRLTVGAWAARAGA